LKNSLFYTFIFFILLIIGFFVSQRNFEIGADTDSYKYYHSVFIDSEGVNTLALEPGFYLLFKLSILFSDSFRFFLFIEFFIFNLLYFFFYLKITYSLKYKISIVQTLFLFGFTLLSSWYLLYSLNGLRQGLATPIVYLSFLFFIERRYLYSSILIFIATSIHSTSILLFPFFFFFRFNFKLIIYLFYTLAFLYFTYFNKFLILLFCKFTGLSPLYNFIIDYGGPDAPDRGPVLRFLIYTLGLPSILIFISNKLLIIKEQNNLKFVLKFYFILCFPYFMLSYGGYSGRLALYAWFLIPYIYSFLITKSKINKYELRILSFLIFLLGTTSYLLLLNSDKLPLIFQGIWGKV